MIWGMVDAGVPRGRLGVARPPVADVIESGRMEVRAKVDENDRANLTEGQDADASKSTRSPAQNVPGQGRRARRGSPAAPVLRDVAAVTRQFDVTFQFDQAGSAHEGRRLRAA